MSVEVEVANRWLKLDDASILGRVCSGDSDSNGQISTKDFQLL